MIYIDQIKQHAVIKDAQARRLGPGWCHLFSDDIEELHGFAKRLSLKREWFQDHKLAPHYDLTPNRREKALKLGATQISTKDYILMRRKNE